MFDVIHKPSERRVLDNSATERFCIANVHGLSSNSQNVNGDVKTSLLLRLPVKESPKPQITLAKGIKIPVSCRLHQNLLC